MLFYTRLIFLAAISSCAYGTLSAQYYHKGDYVITNKGDTLFGTIFKGFFIGGTIKLQQKDSVITYRGEDIEGYYSGQQNALYKKKELPHMLPQLIRCAESGKINVYVIPSGGGATYMPGNAGSAPVMTYAAPNDNVYLEKEAGKLVQVLKTRTYGKNKFEKELFLSLIEDIPAIKELYAENELHDAPDICYYIHEYNLRAAGLKN